MEKAVINPQKILANLENTLNPAGSVLLITGEDSLSDVIRLELELAKALNRNNSE